LIGGSLKVAVAAESHATVGLVAFAGRETVKDRDRAGGSNFENCPIRGSAEGGGTVKVAVATLSNDSCIFGMLRVTGHASHAVQECVRLADTQNAGDKAKDQSESWSSQDVAFHWWPPIQITQNIRELDHGFEINGRSIAEKNKVGAEVV